MVEDAKRLAAIADALLEVYWGAGGFQADNQAKKSDRNQPYDRRARREHDIERPLHEVVPQPPLDSQRFVLAYAFGRRRSGSFDFAPYGRFAQDDSLADPSGRFFRMTGGGSSTLRAAAVVQGNRSPGVHCRYSVFKFVF